MTATWEDGIRAAHAEAAGMLVMYLLDDSYVAAAYAAAVHGDQLAVRLIEVVHYSACQIDSAAHNDPVMCLCCPRPIRKTADIATYAFVLPEVPSPERAIGSAVCAKCAGGRDLLDRAMAAFQRHLWGDIRRIDISASCGHG
jgi:hypothetical protein